MATAPRHLSAASAMAICMASMIGSGIFSITGLMGPMLGTSTNVIVAWILGGVLSLAGAFTVAELAANRPRSGALYVAACETLGHRLGFVNGTVTVLVGYVAASAYIAVVIAAYAQEFIPWIPPRAAATAVLLILTLIHMAWLRGGVRLNDTMAVLKIAMLVVFAIAGLASVGGDASPEAVKTTITPPAPWSMAVGAAVIAISFAYLGWSAAADVAGEVTQPARTLPIAILGSVVAVTILYVLVNLAYVHAIPPSQMVNPTTGEPIADIGGAAATILFGPLIGRIMSLGIIAVLLSTLSTMVFTGGRVLLAISTAGQLPTPLQRLSPTGIPTRALLLQATLCLPFIWLPTLGGLLDYIGLLITICASMSGVAVLIRRYRGERRDWSMPLHPLPVILFLGLSAWLAVSAAIERPMTAFYSVATFGVILLIRPALTGHAKAH
ncbi:MAG TPA: amino acid permease [Phycisphaerales bacterium]|nr:amino acid permease [Phycisphaerales bacterium]